MAALLGAAKKKCEAFLLEDAGKADQHGAPAEATS